MNGALIIGATSAIAVAAARRFAADGMPLVLVARDGEKLATLASDLRVRGARSVATLTLDVRRTDLHAGIVDASFEALPDLDLVLIAHGALVDQETAAEDVTAALESIQVNFTSVVALLTLIAPRLARSGRGTIAVIGSVAGDRGRRKNYVYGAAKGGLDVFLGGLRNSLASSGVHVVTIKPGFVDTPMTASLPKNALFAAPETVGDGIYHAIRSHKDVVYLPWWWRPIMTVIKSIPEVVFKRLNI